MQRIYSETPSPFHMYNLEKLDACSEPRQIPNVDLFAITAFNGFKSLMRDNTLNSSLKNVVHNEISCLRGSFILICIRCICILVLATF